MNTLNDDNFYIMKFAFFIIALALILMSFSSGGNNLDKAKEEAAKSNKYILLNFSGLTWNKDSRQLQKEFFENSYFSGFADSSLITVNIDLDSQHHGKLQNVSPQKLKEQIETYNPQHIYPITHLLDPNGSIIKTWKGVPLSSVEEFVTEMRRIVHAPK